MQEFKNPIPELWRNHQLAEFIELVPTEFISQFRNIKADRIGELTPYGKIVSLDEFWYHLKKNGQYDPLVLTLDKNKNMRLEAGNHRIQIAIENYIDFMPTIAIVSNNCIIHKGNGFHKFDATPHLKWMAPNGVYKPSQLFFF